MPADRLDHLLSPGRIGGLTLPNRIIVTAMGVNLAEPDGTCGTRIRAFHEEQARGGAGLIVVGVAAVAWPTGAVKPWQVAISEDRFIPGLAAMGEAVHRHGAKFAIQLQHGGLVAMQDMLEGRPVWTPSLPEPPEGDFTQAFLLEELQAAPFSRITSVDFKVMTVDDIRHVVGQFASAARRAREAGADGIEIHAGHGYLISSFISPRTNKRTDAYGGPLENRLRFLLEILRAVRETVGPEFPLWCKLDAEEVGRQGGITLADAVASARLVEQAGVDAITVTAYHNTAHGKLHSASNIPHEPGCNLPAAATIRRAVGVPVIASGRIEPAVAEGVLARGEADFIAMGRKLLADPHLPRKLAEGRPQDVRPCVYCYTCVSAIYTGEAVRCAANPRTGYESELPEPQPAATPRRLVVVGGGPAGMETALRLDRMGHAVTLIERAERLGGTLRVAALAYDANERLLDWLIRQVEASGITVRTGTEATPALLARLAPDAVVVASGARRDLPPIPGHDLPHVFRGDDMRRLMFGETSDSLKRKTGWATRLATRVGAASGMTANLDFVRQATRHWMPLGKRVVIVGGELVGLELAEFLHERGRQVTVVDDVPRLGKGLTVVRRMRLLDELREHGVALQAGARDIRIEADAVRFVDAGGEARAVPADHVIVAKGAAGDATLADSLRAAGLTVHLIGDAGGVGYIEGAMRDAARLAATFN